MDERITELVAIGASAAVNCHPCLQHHLAECDRLGLDRADVAAAVEVGMMVNRGAAAKTRTHAGEVLGTGAKEAGGGCGCG
ncbi:MAG TPA: carboxymuconolactone decarboxylase family protein [Candidatus Omnitrophota bacterium]|nr:carboxymuconolactone decarboxylase family protein [Candidatus Omnitrophota bacterium]